MAAPTFTYNVGATAKDNVRLLIPDRPIKKDNQFPSARFSDQELEAILAMPLVANDIAEAAATCCEIIAMDETKRMINVSINSGMSISRGNTPATWLARAKQIREMAAKVPWEYIESMDYAIDGLGIDHSTYVGDIEDEEL